MRRVTLMTLGSPGLRAGKSLAFLLLRGLTLPGRSRTKQADMRIFSKNRAGRGEGTAFKATAFETSQWLPWQKPDTAWAWKLIRLDLGLRHSLALLTADGGSSASSAREWEKNWLDQAVAVLNFRTPRHAAQGGAVDAFRVEALPRRREYQAVRPRRAARRGSTLPGRGPAWAGLRVKPLVLLKGPASA